MATLECCVIGSSIFPQPGFAFGVLTCSIGIGWCSLGGRFPRNPLGGSPGMFWDSPGMFGMCESKWAVASKSQIGAGVPENL